MNPRKAECLGQYGYGDGYFSEDSTRGVFGFFMRGFCDVCIRKMECCKSTSDSILEEFSNEVDTFLDAVRISPLLGISREEVEAGMLRVGNPNPFLREYSLNVSRGMGDHEDD